MSSRFVIGSDDDQIDQSLNENQQHKEEAEDLSDDSSTEEITDKNNNKKETLRSTNYYNSYQHSSFHEDSHSDSQTETKAINHDDTSPFMYENEYKAISDIIDTSQYHKIQLMLHKIVAPLIWLCDRSLIRQRSWLQIPFIKYMTCITSMIIGIALSQLIIKAYELKASSNNVQNGYDLNDVIYFLSAYVLLISILCIAFLYFYYQHYLFSPYHYNYFVMTCSGIIGYALLYLLIHIQSEFYSQSVHASIKCLAGCSMFAISIVGVIIFIKQFVFDFSFVHTLIAQDEYDSDEDNEHNPLLNDDDDDDNNEFMIDKHIDDDELILTEYKEKGVLWFTISCLSLNIWHISIGLVMIECVVYILSASYINLLIDWTHDESTVIRNLWNIIAFGFCLAFITGIAQIALQIYCKSPLYQYQLQLTASNDYNNYNALDSVDSNNVCLSYLSTLPHKEDIILFLLNWINDISLLWNKIVSAAIGWSLLTPNQTNSILTQFITSLTATMLFLFIAYVFIDYKRRIQKDILSEIRDIKKQLKSANVDDDDAELMKVVVYNKQKLLFYDRMHETYDLAFAVAVSYSWESFIVIAISNIFGSNPLNRFITHLILTVGITCIFAQLGLELIDLKRQRLKEAKVNKNRMNEENRANNNNNNAYAVKLQISSRNNVKLQKLLTSP